MSEETNQDNQSISDSIMSAFEAEGQLDDVEVEADVDEGVEDAGVDADPEISEESTEQEEDVTDEQQEAQEDDVNLTEWYRTRDAKYLPEELKPVHKDIVSGGQKAYRALDEEKKKYVKAREQYEAATGKLASDSQDSQEPAVDYSSDEALRESVDALVDYKLGQKLDGRLKKIEDATQATDAKVAEKEFHDQQQARFEKLKNRKGFSEDVALVMTERINSNPDLWGAAIRTQEGIDELFEFALQKDTENKRKSEASKVAKARKGATKKPSDSKGSSDAVKTFAGDIGGIIKDSFREKELE